MPLIPGILRTLSYYKAERDRLAEVGKRRSAGQTADALDFGPAMNLGDVGEEIARSHRMMGLDIEGELPAPPAIKAPRPQYPTYKPPR